MKRPSIIVVGACRARAIRAPKPPRPPAEWYWRAEVHEGGGHRTVWTGWATRAAAEAHLVALVAGGGLRAGDAEPQPVEVRTVRDLLECWMGAQEDRADLRPSSLEAYRTHARILAEILGPVALDRLHRRDLDAFVKRARTAPSAGEKRRARRSDSTMHQDFVVLGAAWTWGRALGLVPDRDLDPPSMSVEPARPKHTPEIGEVQAVLAHLPAWAAAVLRLQYATGARLGEIGALRVRDFDRATLTLTGKTGTRAFPLQAQLMRDLAELTRGMDPDASVFGKSRQGMVKINAMVAAACRREGLPVWTTHALRRSAVDRLLRAPGVDIATAADLLGHTPAVLLKSYRRVTAEDRRRAVQAALAPLPAGDVVAFPARTADAHNGRKG